MTADLAIKQPSRAATNGNITLSGLQTVDGVALAAGDRVLVRAQSNAVDNGIWVAASGAWQRAADFDGASGSEALGGTQVLVTSGTLHGGTAWRVSGDDPVDIGTDSIAFEPAFDSGSVTHLADGSGAVRRTLEAILDEAYLTPEDFGAAGDGTTDDAAAFGALIDAAQAEGLPIRLRSDAIYGVGGADGWSGIHRTLVRDLTIDGNGATIKPLYRPQQSTTGGSHYPIFRFDGTDSAYRVAVRDLSFDFNELKATGISAYRATVEVRGCRFGNGDVGEGGSGDMTVCIYLNRCSGTVDGNYCRNVGYFVYGGHTDAGMFSKNLRIVNNAGEQFYHADTSSVRGDPHNGVLKHSLIEHNVFSGFLGLALSGYNGGDFSEHVSISHNVLSDFSGGGAIQPGDVVNSANAPAVRNRDITIVGNTISNSGRSFNSAGIYVLTCRNVTIAGNTMRDVRYGVLLDKEASHVAVCGNAMAAGTAPDPWGGIHVTGQIGPVDEVAISGNVIDGFINNIVLGGGGGGDVTGIAVTGNLARSGGRGIYIQAPYLQGSVSRAIVDGNSFTGHSVSDVANASTAGGLDCVQFGKNLFDSETGAWFTATYDPPSLAVGASTAIQTMTVEGAAIGDFVEASFSNDVGGARITAWVSTSDTVSYYFTNENGNNPLNLSSGTVRVSVTRA